MNIFLFICCYIFFLFNHLVAHQPREEGGLFAAIYEQQKAFVGGQPVFELTSHGMASKVRIVQGLNDMCKNVLQASCRQPVVLKVTMASCDYPGLVPADHLEMNAIFQDVAQLFSRKINFVSMRLCSHERYGAENFSVMQQLFSQNNIASLIDCKNMPLILFFREGQLYQPIHMPTAVLSGFYTRENLVGFIQKKLFAQGQSVPSQDTTMTSSQVGLDLTTTTSTGRGQASMGKKTAKKTPQSEKKSNEQKGFWQRFWKNLSK